MLNRIVAVIIILPIAIVLIALAVANRGGVDFTIDPFHPGNPALTVHWPLFVYLFIAMAIGLMVGSMATWLRQGQYRKQAREKAAEVRRLTGNMSTGTGSSVAPVAPR